VHRLANTNIKGLDLTDRYGKTTGLQSGDTLVFNRSALTLQVIRDETPLKFTTEKGDRDETRLLDFMSRDATPDGLIQLLCAAAKLDPIRQTLSRTDDLICWRLQ